MDFGLILDAFWHKKSFEFFDRFWLAFWRLDPRSGGVPGECRGTSGGLPRDFEERVSPAQPPQGGALNKKRDHITASGSQTRDPTRPGPEAQRIFMIC